MSTDLVRYDAMCAAIAECHRVDDVLDIHDKARALEVYAMQARNIEAERKACDVRIRAERRTGELLAELARSQTAGLLQGPSSNGGTTGPSPYARALADNNLPRQTAHRYQQLAAVPAPVFEAVMNGDAKPSTRAAIDAARDPVPPMRTDSLWLWGRLRDFEREDFHFVDKNPVDVLNAMTESMQADVRRIAPALCNFLGAMLKGDQ